MGNTFCAGMGFHGRCFFALIFKRLTLGGPRQRTYCDEIGLALRGIDAGTQFSIENSILEPPFVAAQATLVLLKGFIFQVH
jgi:hypothetical protein